MRTSLSATLRRLVAGAGVVLAITAFGSRAEAQEVRDQWHQAPKDTVDQATYDGWKQYNLNCARCHGEDVLGSTIAPHLVMSLKPDGPINTKEAFLQVVCAGRPEKGMPSWCALGMDPPTIEKIYAYVKARSEAKMSPGRPARRDG
jgi:mono/diheme cytochrome c family protein